MPLAKASHMTTPDANGYGMYIPPTGRQASPMAMHRMYGSLTERGNALLGTKSTTFLQVNCNILLTQIH